MNLPFALALPHGMQWVWILFILALPVFALVLFWRLVLALEQIARKPRDSDHSRQTRKE